MKTSLAKNLVFVILASFPLTLSASGLSWWLMPENVQDLPLEVEYDTANSWSELWLRNHSDSQAAPKSFMEQAIGVRWMGAAGKAIIVYNEKYIAEIAGESSRFGKIDKGSKITWNDGSKESLLADKKARRKRKRSRSAKKIHFGKIVLPPANLKQKDFSVLSVKNLEGFLTNLPGATSAFWGAKEFGVISRLSSQGGTGYLGLRYAANCGGDEKAQIENLIEKEVEGKLNCWAGQNTEQAQYLFSALLQKPELSCKVSGESATTVCGRSTLPFKDSFFITGPQIEINTDHCNAEMGNTLLHEILHLAGVKDAEAMDKAIEQAHSCSVLATELKYEGENEEFFNDLQVETRLLLFKKVRDEAKEKWGWSDAEKYFVLGTICSKMQDKYCAQRYFQLATETPGGGDIVLPEGGEVSFAAAAHFGLFDSISESNPRMHELVRYLSCDPNGTFLRRLETGTHRLHEFHVARSALEKVKESKGVCAASADEKITCEDLAQITKSPWFRN